MLQRERSGSSGVSYITDLTAAHIQTPQPACHHQPVQQKTAAAPPMAACTLPLLCTTDTEEFASFSTSQLSVLSSLCPQAAALALVSSKSRFLKNNYSSKGHDQKRWKSRRKICFKLAEWLREFLRWSLAAAVGAQINTRLGAVNPEEAAATAWTYMELLLHSLKMSLQTASTGREYSWKTLTRVLWNHMAPSLSRRSQSCRVCFISTRTLRTEERFPGSYINPSSKNMTENKNIGQFSI